MKTFHPIWKTLPMVGLSAFFGSGVEATARAAISGAEHVVIIRCDGMSPNGVLKAKTPVMRQLMKEGAYTLQARGVMPTSSSPNWASMIMGAVAYIFGLQPPECWIAKPVTDACKSAP